MHPKLLILATLLPAVLTTALMADEPARPTVDSELTPEAREAAARLRESLPPDSEAMAMLSDILAGSSMGPDAGWFRVAVSQSRFDWDYVRQQYDADGDNSVTEQEFTGDAQQFDRVDRDGDGQLTPQDLDWSEHSTKPAAGLFTLADQNGNGKLTRDEAVQFFDDLDSENQGFVALDDLVERIQPFTPQARENRTGGPTPSMLVLGLAKQEIGSLQPGPAVGEAAPDFTLKSLSGESVTLSEEVGDKPIVLIFGNFTCGPFRRQSGNVEKLYERYRDDAKFFLVYVREAHPSDGWAMKSNQQTGVEVAQPTSNADRRSVAEVCQNHLDLKVPFLVDTVDDTVGSTYSGMPNRLYLIDSKGQVAFKNGRGPHGFHPRQLEQALVLMLASKAK